MGGRDVERAHRMASSRQSGSTSLAQPFSDGPFEFDGPDTLAIGERRWSIAIVTPVREPAAKVTGQPGRIGQHNLFPGAAVRVGHAGRGSRSLQIDHAVWQDATTL